MSSMESNSQWLQVNPSSYGRVVDSHLLNLKGGVGVSQGKHQLLLMKLDCKSEVYHLVLTSVTGVQIHATLQTYSCRSQRTSAYSRQQKFIRLQEGGTYPVTWYTARIYFRVVLS